MPRGSVAAAAGAATDAANGRYRAAPFGPAARRSRTMIQGSGSSSAIHGHASGTSALLRGLGLCRASCLTHEGIGARHPTLAIIARTAAEGGGKQRPSGIARELRAALSGHECRARHRPSAARPAQRRRPRWRSGAADSRWRAHWRRCRSAPPGWRAARAAPLCRLLRYGSRHHHTTVTAAASSNTASSHQPGAGGHQPGGGGACAGASCDSQPGVMPRIAAAAAAAAVCVSTGSRVSSLTTGAALCCDSAAMRASRSRQA